MAAAFDLQVVGWAAAGALIGMLIGILPGLGPTATTALLLPLAATLPPTASIAVLAAVYYGSMYGGTIPSVLVNIPGEATAVVTAIDGYPLARQGRAGPTLGVAAIGSFVGGMAGVVVVVVAAPPLAQLASTFGPPEYALLAAAGIVLVVTLRAGAVLPAAIAAAAGILLATVGPDPITKAPRFVPGGFGDAIDLVALATGVFGVAEILDTVGRHGHGAAIATSVASVLPTRQDLRESGGAIARGTLAGGVLGALPGGGPAVATIASYGWERLRATRPERFGRGAIEGVAAPESANNAASTTGFIPLLVLGLPGNAALAVILADLQQHGVTTGPALIQGDERFLWALVASMIVGNVLLLGMNLLLLRPLVEVLRVRMSVLGPLALAIAIVGVYGIRESMADVWVVIGSGIAGYVMRRAGFPAAPLVLAFLFGRLFETSCRQALQAAGGDPTVFLARPASVVMLACAAAALVLLAAARMRAGGRAAPSGDVRSGSTRSDS